MSKLSKLLGKPSVFEFSDFPEMGKVNVYPLKGKHLIWFKEGMTADEQVELSKKIVVNVLLEEKIDNGESKFVPIYTMDDVEDMPMGLIQKIVEAAMKVTGLGKEDDSKVHERIRQIRESKEKDIQSGGQQ